MVSCGSTRLMAGLLDFADIIGPGGKGLDLDQSEDEGSGDDDVEEEQSGLSDEAEGEEDDDDDDEDEEENVSEADQPERNQIIEPVDVSEVKGEAPTKYIPPSLRAAQIAEKSNGDASKVAEKLKLERKTQGLLNKYVNDALI